jgi:coenzyme F420-reducing hydrogenase delta subunit
MEGYMMDDNYINAKAMETISTIVDELYDYADSVEIIRMTLAEIKGICEIANELKGKVKLD